MQRRPGMSRTLMDESKDQDGRSGAARSKRQLANKAVRQRITGAQGVHLSIHGAVNSPGHEGDMFNRVHRGRWKRPYRFPRRDFVAQKFKTAVE